jgi:hypothetical protein
MTSHVLDLFRNLAGLAVYAYDVAAYQVRDRLGLFNVDEVDEIVAYEGDEILALYAELADLEHENNALRRDLNDINVDLTVTKLRLNLAQAQLATRFEAF